VIDIRPVTGQLKLLLWLRLKTMFRARRGPGQLVMMILGIGVLVLFSTGLGMGAHRVTRGLTATAAAEWTHIVLFFVWFMLVTMPVLGFASNEFYDITKLFVYPVTHRTVFVAQTVGMLFGGTALFFLPLLFGLAGGLPGGPGVRLLRMGGMLLFLFHSVAFAQLLQLLLLNLLRSRRFRDVIPVVAALISGGVYLSFRLLGQADDPREWLAGMLDEGFSAYLAPLPADWLAGLIAPGAGAGHLAVFFLAFLPFTLLTVLLAAVLQERAFHGDLAAARPAAEVSGSRSRWRAPAVFRRLPGEVRAIARKELRTIGREPVVKALFIQQFVFILVPVGFAVVSSPRALQWGIYAFLLVESILAFNLLGLEGPGIAQLLQTPVSRRRILGGKILANLLLWGPVNLVLLCIILALMSLFAVRPTLPGAIALVTGSVSGLLVLLGLGAVLSPLAPVRIGARGRRALSHGQSNEGCLSALSRLGAMMIMCVLMVPVVLLCRVGGPGLWCLLAPVYAAAVLWLGLRIGSASLVRREERIIATLSRGTA